MKLFSQLPESERADFIYEYAAPRNFQPFIVEKDHESMKPMFLVEPPTFAEVIGVLREAEKSLNGA
ncbi:MAG: hypothetical protein K8T20_17975 [Planctomycetes bacterium]|nr:hypothetical protein [Planctomycetota bacterium]